MITEKDLTKVTNLTKENSSPYLQVIILIVVTKKMMFLQSRAKNCLFGQDLVNLLFLTRTTDPRFADLITSLVNNISPIFALKNQSEKNTAHDTYFNFNFNFIYWLIGVIIEL